VIYSRFGTELTLKSKSEDSSGQVLIHAMCAGMQEIREYHRADLTADDGPREIDAAIAKLPTKQK
jgi:hypothetical protein